MGIKTGNLSSGDASALFIPSILIVNFKYSASNRFYLLGFKLQAVQNVEPVLDPAPGDYGRRIRSGLDRKSRIDRDVNQWRFARDIFLGVLHAHR